MAADLEYFTDSYSLDQSTVKDSLIPRWKIRSGKSK